jgi:hypothetical protein
MVDGLKKVDDKEVIEFFHYCAELGHPTSAILYAFSQKYDVFEKGGIKMDSEPHIMITKSQFDTLVARNEKTLRDEMAIGALVGLFSCHPILEAIQKERKDEPINGVAKYCYVIADAMMKERNKNG